MVIDMKCKKILSFVIILILLAVLFVVAVNSGSVKVSYGELLKGIFIEHNDNVNIILDLRFPRILIAMLSGAALAVSGVLFQAVFLWCRFRKCDYYSLFPDLVFVYSYIFIFRGYGSLCPCL